MQLYQIRAPHFTAGLEVSCGIVTRAAPIVKYMMYWTPERVLSYCRKRQWLCNWIE